MNPRALLSRRWGRTQRPAEGPTSVRSEVQPPSLRHAPESFWRRLWFWVTAPAPGDVAPPVGQLPGIRATFLSALADMQGDEVTQVRQKIASAHTLRELWHLRADIYRVVGLHHDQATAEQRLADLNRHFHTRTTRDGFMPW